MTNDTVTNYSPYNMYQLYGHQYPAFRGTQIRQAGVSQPAQPVPRIDLNIQPDTVEFSANNKIQQNGMSTTTKALIGLATVGTLIGGYFLHKNMTSPAKKLSKIFRREITSEEATQLMNRYKEIAKVENKEEYIKQMFKQLKKDYGWEGIDFTYNLNRTTNLTGGSVGGFRPLSITGKTAPDGNYYIESFTPEIMEVCLNRSKEDIFATMVHEFQHCKQHEIAYRADKNKFIEAMIKKRLSPEMTEEIAMFKDAIDKYYAPVWDKLPALAKGSKEYELGLKYIDNIEHYVSASEDKIKYMQQLVEREAYSAGDKAKDIYKKALS